MNISICKPDTYTDVTQAIMLFRKSKKWGLLRVSNSDAFGMSQYVLPTAGFSASQNPENALLPYVFRFTGAFGFELKTVFDFEAVDGTVTHGRIYVISLPSEHANSNDILNYFSCDKLPEKTENREFVYDLLCRADLLANIYF